MAFGIDDIIGAGLQIINKFIPDPAAQQEAAQALKLAMLTAQQSADKEQADIDTTEAASTNWFVAGWRPFIGWVCGGSLAYNFVGMPFMMFVCNLIGHPITLPALDLSELTTILLGMLGMSGLRTYEKTQNVHSAH